MAVDAPTVLTAYYLEKNFPKAFDEIKDVYTGIFQQMTSTFDMNLTFAYQNGSPDGNATLLYYLSNNPISNFSGLSNMSDLFATGWTDITSPTSVFNNGGTILFLINAGHYFGLIFTTPTIGVNTLVVTGIPSADGECFLGDTHILLADKSTKKIKDICRGDIIMEDITTKKTNVVAHLHKKYIAYNCFLIPKNLINNTDDIICTRHPIWCNQGNGRIFPENINGVTQLAIYDYMYDIQFEDEGTFYVNGIKVDSLPPNAPNGKLKKELYFDQSKYTEYILSGEDDPIRNKPPIINNASSIDSLYNFEISFVYT
jgi:hypothetical protein